MTPVITLNRLSLESRLAELLQFLGLTKNEYVQKANENALQGVEWDVQDELNGLLFLLGNEASAS